MNKKGPLKDLQAIGKNLPNKSIKKIKEEIRKQANIGLELNTPRQ